MGRAAFWREVMVSSPPAAPWGGLSVNYIQLGLCTIKTSAGCCSSPTIPFPPHHQLDPDRYSHFAWAQRNQKGEKKPNTVMWWCYLSISNLSAHRDRRNTPAAAVPPQLQLSDRMFWETPQHFANGRREAGHEGKSGNANSNPPDSLKSDLKCQNSSDGRQSRERERNGWPTAFHGLSGRDTLSAGHTVSH